MYSIYLRIKVMTPYIQAEIEIHQNIKTLGSSDQL
jgi:hypothetical protein